MPSNPGRLTELPWLPRLSPSFGESLRAIEARENSDWGPPMRALATQFLGLSQSLTLARACERLQHGQRTSLTKFRLGLVSHATTDFVRPLLIASALRFGLSLEVVTADFGQVVQEAIDPQSHLNRANLDAVLLALDHRGLPFRLPSDNGWPPFDASVALGELATIRHGFSTHGGTTCLVQTVPAPAELLLGSLDLATAGTLRSAVATFNARLVQEVAQRGDVLLDVDWLAQCIGLDEWYDDRQWHLARMSCSQKSLPLYADFVCRTIAALRGKSRKCLVLDLDNTLWGGVIGDDGLEGIALNPGDARGESFRAVQQAAIDLRRRGVVLAVCSKNDESTARLPFRSHPGMLLKEDHIAVFAANWDDKATNLERIARRLDIGLDALVLLDDNPVERAQVREALPQVAVPELGDDPSTYPRALLAAGYFESAGFTAEDLMRAEQYRGNVERERALEGARNLDEFLRSLRMQIEFAPFTAQNRKRITQLINKTNQFNVTTRRYTEQEVARFEHSSDHYALQVHVRDRFGDNGMVCVVICTINGEDWEVDTWLMSCRVLNRGVEGAVCNRVARDARRAGARRILATYIRTERNAIVADLFSRLGFTRGHDVQRGESWILNLVDFTPLKEPFSEAEPAEAVAAQS